ncbi:MAG TPA: hypothetical protein VIK29_00825 [Paludibacter sp.]
MTNTHSQSIPANVLEQAIAKINEAGTLLNPYMVTLTPTERADMLKMGDRTLGFVQKSNEYGKTNPEFAPGYLNLGDFNIDFADSQNLVSILNILTQFSNGIDDTKMVAGSEAYQAALLYYNGVQRAVEMNVPGAKAIYDELKNRFPSRAKKKIVPEV